jgi:hypothetical protein
MLCPRRYEMNKKIFSKGVVQFGILVGGSVLILLLIILFGNFILDILARLFGKANAITSLKEIEIKSPEQFEQLLMCMRERAHSCNSVQKGKYNLLKDVENFEDCACAGDFIAGTDVVVKLNFEKEEAIEIKDKFAGFGKVEKYDNRCFLRVQKTNLWKSEDFLLLHDVKNNELKKGDKVLVVVNRGFRPSIDVWRPVIEGCIELLG